MLPMQVLEDVTAMALWLTIPISAPSTTSAQADATTSEQSDASTITADSVACTAQAHSDGAAYGAVQEDGWETWHSMRTLCSHDTLLGAVLQLGKQVGLYVDLHPVNTDLTPAVHIMMILQLIYSVVFPRRAVLS